MDLKKTYQKAHEQAIEACIRSSSFLGLGIHSVEDKPSKQALISKDIDKSQLPKGIKLKQFDSSPL